ncbi:hypothetical protein PQG83_19485 [Candidatus Nitrospira neomarina]|uniref:DDE domain-containing protein n=1 Tax=Candidatus Nitrospira neomarina TaxID=3020899 RepID=A0AA96K2K1_9BACT|nr:hypothetical protein PQG83_19485 [Candidatus Nitrospira neomarina]
MRGERQYLWRAVDQEGDTIILWCSVAAISAPRKVLSS